MKHKVAELEGALLDAAVAKAEGLSGGYLFQKHYSPSSVWMVGGPIIERERINVGAGIPPTHTDWLSWIAFDEPGRGAEFFHRGPTPLIAAMRTYVASKYGAEIEL